MAKKTKLPRVRKLREENQISQAKIAERIGITQRSYSRYENADSAMPIDILIKIADYYEVSVDYLLELTDVPQKRRSGQKKKTIG